MAERFGQFRLALQEQALDFQGADLVFFKGPEDHVQGNPVGGPAHQQAEQRQHPDGGVEVPDCHLYQAEQKAEDRKSTRLNSSHVRISYAVFCLKKKKKKKKNYHEYSKRI